MDRLVTPSFGQALGLSFLNSAPSSCRGEAEDPLEDGAALLAWLSRAGVGPGGEIAQRWVESRTAELDGVAAKARKLREWFRDFVRKNLGRSLTSADLAKLRKLNLLVRGERRFYQIVVSEGGKMPLALRSLSPWSSPESALILIGEVLAVFVCEVDFARLRVCEGVNCSLLFVDQSRALARRWCSMAKCGNRSKQASLRSRARP